MTKRIHIKVTQESKRDRVKDAIRDCMRDDDVKDADYIAYIADAVFDALGIDEDEQDKP